MQFLSTSIKLGFYLQTNTWIYSEKGVSIFNIIKFLYCSFVIATGKRKATDKEKALYLLFGKFKKKNPSDRE